MTSHNSRWRLVVLVVSLLAARGRAAAQQPPVAPPVSDSAAVFAQAVDFLQASPRDTLRLARVPDTPWARAATAGLRARSALAAPDAYALTLDAPRFVGDTARVRIVQARCSAGGTYNALEREVIFWRVASGWRLVPGGSISHSDGACGRLRSAGPPRAPAG